MKLEINDQHIACESNVINKNKYWLSNNSSIKPLTNRTKE